MARWSALGAVLLPALLLAGGLPIASDAGAAAGSCPIDTMLVMDRSSSMYGPPSQAARAGGVRFLDVLDASDQSGVRGFAADAADKGLDKNHEQSKAAVVGAGVGGSNNPPTNSQGQAMDAARMDLLLGRPGAAKVMIVFSDGFNADTNPIASQAKAEGVRIFSIATGSSVDRNHMRGIASDPKSLYYFEVRTPAEAESAMDRVRATVLDCPLFPKIQPFAFCAGGEVALIPRGQSAGFVPAAWAIWSFDDGHPKIAGPPAEVQYRRANSTFVATLTFEDAAGRAFNISRAYVPRDCAALEVLPHCYATDQAYEVRARAQTVALDAPVVSIRWFGPDIDHEGEGVVVQTREPITLHVIAKDELGQVATASVDCDPRLNHPPWVDVYDVTVTGGKVATMHAIGVDPDHDALAWTWDLNAAPGAHATGNAFAWPTDPKDDGTYGPFSATVSDGEFEAKASFFVHVVPFLSQPVVDSDLDGAPDTGDNCAGRQNREQTDADSDLRGDTCQEAATDTAQDAGRAGDHDRDADGIGDRADVCPDIPDPEQMDMDLDRTGDACDADLDGDGIGNDVDVCLRVPDPLQRDSDADGVGDLCSHAAAHGQNRAEPSGPAGLQGLSELGAPASAPGETARLGGPTVAVGAFLLLLAGTFWFARSMKRL